MAEISTRELIDRYCESQKDSYKSRVTKASFDKPELFEYETELGKEFLDMNEQELIGLIAKLRVNYSNYSSNQLKTIIRNLFNYYIDIADVKIKNPTYSEEMVSRNIDKELMKTKEPLTKEKLDYVIGNLHTKYADRADYMELILCMWYDGFYKADDIILLKEEMINPRGLYVTLPGRTIRIRPRTYELLQKFNKRTDLEDTRTYALESWHGSYFKFSVHQSKRSTINEKTLKQMQMFIYYSVDEYVNVNYEDVIGVRINYRNVYWLGFFDYLSRKYGKEKASSMVLSYRNSDDLNNLELSAKEYGAYYSDAARLKKYLKELVSISE